MRNGTSSPATRSEKQTVGEDIRSRGPLVPTTCPLIALHFSFFAADFSPLARSIVSAVVRPSNRSSRTRTLPRGQLSTLFARAPSSCANLYNNFVLSAVEIKLREQLAFASARTASRNASCSRSYVSFDCQPIRPGIADIIDRARSTFAGFELNIDENLAVADNIANIGIVRCRVF